MLYIISISVVVIDQFVKYLVRSNMTVHQSIPIIKNVLHISHVGNTGMAFGMFTGSNTVFKIIATIIVIVIIIMERRGKITATHEKVLFGLVVGGATGNLIDRYVFGHVTDFIDFRIFPVFNVADMSIFIASCFLFIIYFRRKPEDNSIKDETIPPEDKPVETEDIM